MIQMRRKLKDGRLVEIRMLSRKDSVRELNMHINSFIAEDAYILFDRKVSMKDEAAWKKNQLTMQRKGEGFLLVAMVDGKLAATSGATKERGKARGNVSIGIAVAKGFRGIGLGEALMKENIAQCRKRLKPRNIYLSVFAPNKPACSLYKKLGFRDFAVFPDWILQNGKYVDQKLMILRHGRR